MNKCILNICL